MTNQYQPINNYESCDYCDKCLCKYKKYNLKWNNKSFKCVLNDNRSIVLYGKHSQPVRFNYRNIKRIEMRKWMKIVLIMDHDQEIVFKGWRRKSVFNALKNYFTLQMIV